MASFPLLKTGAAAQYPLDYGLRYLTQSVRFLDGSQQKFPLYGTGMRRWTLKLDLLGEDELASVIAFVEQQGSAPFAFSDPATGAMVANCVISGEQLDVTLKDEMKGQTTIVIEEIA